MNIRDSVKLMQIYAACPKCGCEVIGNGKGTLEADTSIGYFKRTCHCGWFVEVKEGVQEVSDRVLQALDLLDEEPEEPPAAEPSAPELAADEPPVPVKEQPAPPIDALSQVEEDIIKAALGRLSAYEETGMEPCDYATMRHALEKAEQAQADLTEMICIVGGVGYSRIRELAQADKEHRLIVPPCKPGDTIWWADRNFHETPVQEIVLSVTAYVNENVWINCVAREHRVSSIGKTVFLTREEAEKALRGGDPDA